MKIHTKCMKISFVLWTPEYQSLEVCLVHKRNSKEKKINNVYSDIYGIFLSVCVIWEQYKRNTCYCLIWCQLPKHLAKSRSINFVHRCTSSVLDCICWFFASFSFAFSHPIIGVFLIGIRAIFFVCWVYHRFSICFFICWLICILPGFWTYLRFVYYTELTKFTRAESKAQMCSSSFGNKVSRSLVAQTTLVHAWVIWLWLKLPGLL